MKNLFRYIRFVLTGISCLLAVEGFSQGVPTDTIPPDPARVAAYTIQNLRFGAFTQGAIGGTISISPSGVRTASGDVVLLNMGVLYSEAIFEIEGIPGTVISVNNGPNATLTGSNGGSMSMTIGASNPVSPFTLLVQPPSRTQINIGGTLHVGSPAANPPGTYTGTFYITFNQE